MRRERGPDEGRLPVADALSFALLIPSHELPTKTARQVLPESVPFSDAVYNLSQLACSLSALADGDAALVRQVFKDRLHQPYRFPLIEDARHLTALAREQGALAVTLSGAGPALFLIRRRGDRLDGLKNALSGDPGSLYRDVLKTTLRLTGAPRIGGAGALTQVRP